MIEKFYAQLQTLGRQMLITQRQRVQHMPSPCSSLIMIVFTYR
jgi:hypothetical protein